MMLQAPSNGVTKIRQILAVLGVIAILMPEM